MSNDSDLSVEGCSTNAEKGRLLDELLTRRPVGVAAIVKGGICIELVIATVLEEEVAAHVKTRGITIVSGLLRRELTWTSGGPVASWL